MNVDFGSRGSPAEQPAAARFRLGLEADEPVAPGDAERARRRALRSLEPEPGEEALRRAEAEVTEDRHPYARVDLLQEPLRIAERVRHLVVGEPGDDARVTAGQRLLGQPSPHVEVLGDATEVF